jgi:hypothetical protein
VYQAVPIRPNINPTKEHAYEKKLRKNVDSSICITINMGNATPITRSRKPSQIKVMGSQFLI